MFGGNVQPHSPSRLPVTTAPPPLPSLDHTASPQTLVIQTAAWLLIHCIISWVYLNNPLNYNCGLHFLDLACQLLETAGLPLQQYTRSLQFESSGMVHFNVNKCNWMLLCHLQCMVRACHPIKMLVCLNKMFPGVSDVSDVICICGYCWRSDFNAQLVDYCARFMPITLRGSQQLYLSV